MKLEYRAGYKAGKAARASGKYKTPDSAAVALAPEGLYSEEMDAWMDGFYAGWKGDREL